MTARDRDNQGLLDALDSALVTAIKGAVWFPLVDLPRSLMGAFPIAVKSARILGLFAVWALVVFGPLAFLDVVDEVSLVLIVGWTALALMGSAVAVLKAASRARARQSKPPGFAEAYV